MTAKEEGGGGDSSDFRHLSYVVPFIPFFVTRFAVTRLSGCGGSVKIIPIRFLVNSADKSVFSVLKFRIPMLKIIIFTSFETCHSFGQC